MIVFYDESTEMTEEQFQKLIERAKLREKKMNPEVKKFLSERKIYLSEKKQFKQ